MRLAVSNIAWDLSEDQSVADLLNSHDIDAIDIAPGKYFPKPAEATINSIKTVRTWWSSRGIEITGMQALLFGTNGLNVFGNADSQSRLLKHLQSICHIAEQLHAPLLVFGSPKNRDTGGFTDEQTFDIATHFFNCLATIAQNHGVIVCLEPNPACYGANFMTNSQETADIVNAINHPAIRMQFDSGATTINKENPISVITRHQDLIGHCHLSEPDLITLGDAQTDHATIANALQRVLPNHSLSIEMVASTTEPHLVSLRRAIQYCTEHYRGNKGII